MLNLRLICYDSQQFSNQKCLQVEFSSTSFAFAAIARPSSRPEHFSSGLGFLGLGTHLFVKITRPGDSEVTFSVFESSCHLLLPV